MVTKNKMVTVSYNLRKSSQGEVVESATPETPMRFICGQGQTLEYFEMNLLNLSEGDVFDFTIPCAQAYGERNEDLVVALPKGIFSEVEEGEMLVGNVLPMTDSMGRHLMGEILEIGEEEVKLDFNHPLSGNNLYFDGKVLEVRDATDEELEALHSHCGGGCESCCGSEGCGSSYGC